MATKYWVGRASSVAQVTSVIFSTITAGQTYSVTINEKTVSYTALTGTLSDLIDALIAAWDSSGEPEHQELTAAEWLDPTLVGLQLTADEAGVPITITASATTGSATVNDEVVASGPNFWNLADNWNGATLPSGGDALVVENSDVDILWGLTDTNVYLSLEISSTFTGSIGLPVTNQNDYPEYRTRFLTLGNGTGAAICNIGYGSGTQANRVNIDFTATATTLTIYGTTGNQQDDSPVWIKNTKNMSTINIYGGNVFLDADTAQGASALNVVAQAGSQDTPSVRSASTMVITTITAFGGEVLIEGNFTTLVAREAAEVTVSRAAAGATVQVSSRASLFWETSGGITTKLHVQPEGTVDFGRVGTGKTVAACDVYNGATLLDPLDKITWTSGVVLVGCRIGDVTLDLGFGVTLA